MTIQTRAQNIERISKIARSVCELGILIGIAACFFVLYLLFFNPMTLDVIIRQHLIAPQIPTTINDVVRLGILVVNFPPILLAISIFILARALFVNFLKSEVFTHKNAQYIARIGWIIVSITPIMLISRTLNTLILTINNPAGERHIALSFESADISAVIIGLLFATLGHVFYEAVQISKDNEQII